MKNQGDETTVVEGMMMTEAEGDEWDLSNGPNRRSTDAECEWYVSSR